MPDSREDQVAPTRRKNDPQNEDHRRERHYDWREMAPRWALVTGIAIFMASTFFLMGKNSNLDDERLEIMAKYQSDVRWDLLSRLSEEQGIQRARIQQHESQLNQLTKAADDIADMRADLRVMKRLVERGGR